jgi:archaetidylinositol phosphate synthase
MLNRLRSKLVPFTSKLGIKLGSLGLSPTVWSLIGFATSIASAASFGSAIISTSLPLVAIGSLLLLLSGFFDIVDGSVARSTNRITKKGGFVDSILDKLGEIAVFIGISVGGLASPVLCLIAAATSLMVSYSRARGESLGIAVEGVGIGERAERLLVIAIAGFIPLQYSLEVGVIVVSILSLFTFLQRFRYIVGKLRD